MAASVLWSGRPAASRTAAPATVLNLMVCVGVLAVVWLLKLPLLLVAGVTPFGMIRALYLTLAFALPIGGALFLLAPARAAGGARRFTTASRVLAAGLVLIAPVAAYARWVEPFRLQLERAGLELDQGRTSAAPVVLGVLADIQTDRITAHEERAVAMLMAERPDVILLPGDLFHGTAEQMRAQLPAIRTLLGRLSAPGGVFFVLGNTDRSKKEVLNALAGTSVRLLENEIVRVDIGGQPLTIAGLGRSYQTRDAGQIVERLQREPGDEPRLLVSHFPDAISRLDNDSRIDLVVAGHTHGGQIVVPGFGPPLTLSSVPRSVAAGGLHRVRGNAIYVSRGVGLERGQAPRIRFFCPPEVSVVTLQTK